MVKAPSRKDKVLWTVKDLARELEVGPRAARKRCEKRTVPGARLVGRRWFIHVETFLDLFREEAPRPFVSARTVDRRPRAVGRAALDRAFRATSRGVA